MKSTIGFAIVLLGCTSSPKYIAGFDPPPTPAGYTRYITPTVHDVMPGDSDEYCQWLAAPSDHDQDVLAMDAHQSLTGHHVILYATTETNFKVGETHLCTVADMVSISFIGGAGGEGNTNASAELPPGLFFRLPAGMALMANVHWLNESDTTVDGQAVIDVKYAPASNTRTIADLFANNGDTFSLPSGQLTAYDNSCVVQQDLNFALFNNHMHQYGTSIYTEVIHTDGTKEMIISNPTWSPEYQFNPTFAQYTLATPFAVHAGDTIHTHCEWTNTSSSTLTFPYEMCVGDGFYFPSQGQITCSDGGWNQ